MTTILFTTVGYQSWVVPTDWNNVNNFIEAIGGGAGGVTEPTGGGGGGYARSNNIICTPGQKIYIRVGDGGHTPRGALVGVNGEISWASKISNAVPGYANQGVAADGGKGGNFYVPDQQVGGAGLVGELLTSGGNGSPTDIVFGGSGGGAGGPHGNGFPGAIDVNGYGYGGAGDAGYGGAGGISNGNYSSINNGQNGANNGSGGGGAHSTAPEITTRSSHTITVRGTTGIDDVAGYGGLYGGGGGSTHESSNGAQGIVKITYTPYVPTPNTPYIPPPNTITTNTTSNTPPPDIPPPPDCVPSGIDTATPAQVYWSYGAWSDPWNNVSSAHYDTNYKQLLGLTGDNDSNNYDIQYNSTLPWNSINEKENFYFDYPRIWKSRSNEWVEDAGQKSIWMRHRTLIGDPDCVPNIDPPSGYCTLLTNLLFMDEQTYGYRLSYSNNIGYFNPGDIVTQQIDANRNVSGTVYMMDPNYIYVNIPVGSFFGGYSIVNAFDETINAFVTSSVEINEKYSANVFPGQSRYITKSTILQSGMDAEDLQIFATAYRPANSNFKIYGKVISSVDPGKYVDRIWTRLVESNSTATSFSALTNSKDYVNVKFELPLSQFVFGNMQSCSCNTTSLDITVPSVHQFAAGDYIYLSSPEQGTFNVRQIVIIPNNSTLSISSYPSFSNTSNLNIGIIPGLEDSTGAFLYDQNSNVSRYVTNNDVSFDMFNQFAVKIVPISDNPVFCPTLTEFRAVALQATA